MRIALLVLALVACEREPVPDGVACTMREAAAGTLIECGDVVVTVANDADVWCAWRADSAEGRAVCAATGYGCR